MSLVAKSITIKRWNRQIEEEIKNIWEKEWQQLYGFNPNTNKKIFVIDTPPPYPAPSWHIGAAISYAMQDIVARAFRMLGFEVFYPMGLDRNGIPVEWYVEKYEKINMWEYPREEFIKKCSTILDEYCKKMIKIMKDLLISADFNNVYYTDSEEYRKLTQATFIDAWRKNLIYEGFVPVNFCPKCKTTIADSEVLHEQKESILYYINFETTDKEKIKIATTRPELLGACGLVIFNPADKRYQHLAGKKAIVPLYNKEVPIIARNEAKPDFGSGLMMVCSYGDTTDVRIFRELKLSSNVIIDANGVMKDKILKGLKVVEARKKIVELLNQKGLLEKTERIVSSVPVHDKCRTEIEIIESKEYFLKQLDFLPKIKELVHKMEWHPEHHKIKLLNWINSITMDWPISRKRYYGTEIPLWKCKNCGFVYVPEPGKYYQPWKQNPPISSCPKCSSNQWEGEERILDTWFDSSVSLLFITKFLKDKQFFEKTFNGIKLRPQGYDIIRTWLYYSLLRIYQIINKKAFEHVMINGMGLDAKGRKMSKSLGNVIIPEEVIEKYGADALRLWSALECTIGSDYRINEAKIAGTQKFLTKLINIARFISQIPPKQTNELKPTDKWIMNHIEKLKKEVTKAYSNFDFHLAAQKLYSFAWDVFASHYLELVKKRAKNGCDSASFALHYTLQELLKLLAPIIPATTDYIYRKLYEESVHTKTFEIKQFDEEWIKKGKKLMEFNSLVWNEKRKARKSLKEEIEIEIPKELEEFREDLIACHNIKSYQ